MKNVLILGASGMLGSMVADYLSRDHSLGVSGTVRSPALLTRFSRLYPDVTWRDFSYGPESRSLAFEALGRPEWIVNAIGVTKPLIKDDNSEQVENAVSVNCMLPHDLGRFAASCGCRVLQIATDCVYSGQGSFYRESSPHDALDVYGKTKSIGETWQANVHHLRCSIIGPEPKDFKFLVEWFRRQPSGAKVNGFQNHHWNGVTTLHFAKVCKGIIDNDIELGHSQHVVPNGTASKAQMLKDFATAYKRTDISINSVDAATIVDRTLSTDNPDRNTMLWNAAGYKIIPTVPQMIEELGSYNYRGAGGTEC